MMRVLAHFFPMLLCFATKMKNIKQIIETLKNIKEIFLGKGTSMGTSLEI
jgi:hypothetical protein